jgi:hypothetical protein
VSIGTYKSIDDKAPSPVLGVLHLSRFWSRHIAAVSGESLPLEKKDLTWDRILLDGLGIALECTKQYFRNKPSLEEFERWIIATNGGRIDPVHIQRINDTVSGGRSSLEVQQYLSAVDTIEPVLTKADLEHWDEHGYVILREAIPREQARAAEEAVWNDLGMTPNDPLSWYERSIGKGIMTELYYHPALNAARSSMRIRKAFAQLWDSNDLWVTTDRAGFNPPETEKFQFPGPRLHWDMNLTQPSEFGTQGILYLCDTPPNHGAFSCIPGFHKRLDTWLAGLLENIDPRRAVLNLPATSIGANAGDLIIWHRALPHGSSPNRGTYPRIVQYINMYVSRTAKHKPWK